MSTIKAPFNFVPLSDKVYFPDWADQISHDIPFSDGLSGTIELKITAQTPIFVRNGHTKADAEEKNDEYKSFSKVGNQYFIPGTSIKGAIRNVLEIMSFGKMNKVSDKRYSVRDLQLKKYMEFFQNSDIHCGWLTIDGETATITDNGIPRRISHKEIDEYLETDFCEKFSNQDFLKKDSNRSPIYKYQIVGNSRLTYKFKELPLNPNNTVDKRIRVVITDNGIPGTIVFTGQPSFRKPAEKNNSGEIIRKASGKFYEFVFFDHVLTKYTLNTEEENGIYKDFCFIYKDSEEWKYWKKKLNKGGAVPVFFSVKSGKIEHFGLSYLYKLPYWGRVKDYLYADHVTKSLDLSDCIFGTIDDKISLKGRIQFSNALCTSGEPYHSEIAPYLGSPKPSYYPIYMKQDGQNGMMIKDGKGVFFSTMLNKDAKLKGWKYYPIQDDWQTKFNIPKGQEKNTNPFIPLNTNSEFSCRVMYHNLKPIELAALVAAIALRDGCFHSIGFAKPFGYGVSKVEITNVSKEDVLKHVNMFTEFMSDQIENYSKTPQMKEFWGMHRPQKTKSPLEYMELKEFVECKKQHFNDDKNQTFGEYLEFYTQNIVRQDSQPKATTPKVAIAEVTVVGQFKQAKLIEGKDLQSKKLIVDKAKLKIGDKIRVEMIMSKAGKVMELKFIEKV